MNLPLPLFLRAVDPRAYAAVAATLSDPLTPSALPWVERTLDAASHRDSLEAASVRERLAFVDELRRGGSVDLGEASGDVLFAILSSCAFPGFVLYPTAPDQHVFVLGDDDGGYGLWLRSTDPTLFQQPPPPAPVPLGHQLHLVDQATLPSVRRALLPEACPPEHRIRHERLRAWLDNLEPWQLALSDL